jgi:myo-inositol-1(or 4)-monophosphatase
MEEFLNVATNAAKKAGDYLMKELNEGKIGKVLGKEDRESEKLIIKEIKKRFPEHGFLGEELGEESSKSEYKWIIDPIDGTNNYLGGRDTFSVSIALEYLGEIIIGVVYLPKRNELFSAEKGKGAKLDGKKIKVRSNSDLSKAIITLSIYPGSEKIMEGITKRIVSSVPKLKYFGFDKNQEADSTFGRGSMAAEFCYLACSRIDGLIRLKQKPWDVAAGSLIALEAGAEMRNLKGEKCSVYEGDYISANQKLLLKIMGIINN